MKKYSTDLYIGLLLLLFCFIFWFFIIPLYIIGQQQSFFPKLIIFILAIFSFMLVFQSLKKKNIIKNIEQARENNMQACSVRKKLFFLVMIWIVYISLIKYLGFYFSGLLMLNISIVNLGVKNWKKIF